ncbi:UNKNOWN [Stylonychia lemnae]|uniref:Uncharacterized protein n=1 Tax=Stylonychia lemnae TaxID=5949 RepID=A0A078B1A8_STYLE|nr:UNKNOWN [Stylonychia lemnae]|eukprot:CDW86933.1 UNKNOWN [Stylonychia lemnae]
MRSLFVVSVFLAATASANINSFLRTAFKSISPQTVVNAEPVHTIQTLKDGDWPTVHTYENFELDAVVNTWDPTTKTLTQYKNMTMNQKIDTRGNRELTSMKSDIPNLGYTEIITYVDFTTNVLYQRIPDLNICNHMDNPVPWNLTQFFAAAQDPKRGLTQYLGVQQKEWATHDLHAFNLTLDVKGKGKESEVLYFCTKTLDLKFITVDSQPTVVVQIPRIQEKLFTDDDFKGQDCSTQKTPHFIKDIDFARAHSLLF